MSDGEATAAILGEIVIEATVPLPEPIAEERLSSLVSFILGAEEATGTWAVGFRFVSDDEMQRMHLEFMGLDSPTDIMTFPYEADDEWLVFDGSDDEGDQGGDIVISVERAQEQSVDGGWDLTHELLFLVCHGMLHLLGWDDASDADRKLMLDRQRVLLENWLRESSLS